MYLTRRKQHRATRRFIRERHAALLAELLTDTIGQLMTYSEPTHRPASDGLMQISWRHNEDRKH